MITSLVLIEGATVKKEKLKSLPLSNAKQLVVGSAIGFGIILHVAASTPADLGNALIKFATVPGVTGVVPLILRTP